MTTTFPDYGAALYGSRWQTDLAEALGVSDRTVRRWVADPEIVPAVAWSDMRRLCRERANELARLGKEPKK